VIGAATPDPRRERPLLPLPAQGSDIPWPTERWPEGPEPDGVVLGPLFEAAFDDDGPLALTQAVVVVHRGRVVAERYQGALDRFDGPPEPVTAGTPLPSWSMAKSMLHAAIGFVIADGLLDPDAPAPVPEWADDDDPRGRITLEHLLAMRDGLAFCEDYVDDHTSDVLPMLFGPGRDDVAHFAADRPLAAEPGTRFNYSSGTANVLAGVLARTLAPERTDGFLSRRLFDPIGMASAVPTLDSAGTWVASSFVTATARDFARFGLLYLRDGVWDGARLLPEGWVDHGRRLRSVVAEDGSLYGALWWIEDDGRGTFRAAGYEGQSITVCPALDLVVVRLGKTLAERYPDLAAWRAAMVAAFDPSATG
jgi:CubicO group peptidase (beta-lactamase class C family)